SMILVTTCVARAVVVAMIALPDVVPRANVRLVCCGRCLAPLRLNLVHELAVRRLAGAESTGTGGLHQTVFCGYMQYRVPCRVAADVHRVPPLLSDGYLFLQQATVEDNPSTGSLLPNPWKVATQSTCSPPRRPREGCHLLQVKSAPIGAQRRRVSIV